jgi:hypothetical protein
MLTDWWLQPMKMPVIGDHHQISVLNMKKISETTNRIALKQKLPESHGFFRSNYECFL